MLEDSMSFPLCSGFSVSLPYSYSTVGCEGHLDGKGIDVTGHRVGCCTRFAGLSKGVDVYGINTLVSMHLGACPFGKALRKMCMHKRTATYFVVRSGRHSGKC